MSEPTNQPQNTPQPDQKPDNSAPWNDPTRAEDAIKELREENKQRRLQYEALNQQFTTIQEQLAQLVKASGGNQDEEANPVDVLGQQLSTLQNQFQQQQEVARQAQIQALRVAIAREFELPQGMESRLNGDTEEAIREDAKALKELIPSNQTQQQRRTTGVPGGQPSSDRTEYWRKRLYGQQEADTPDTHSGLRINL